jgi:hypothetical protein
MQCNLIGPEGAYYIAEALRDSYTLKGLGMRKYSDIGSNELGEDGARYMSKALGVRCPLSYLSI